MQSEPQGARTLVWALPRSLAATYGIDVSFSSSGYLDVSVHRVPLHTLWIGVWMTEVSSAGFPHSDISGSMDICSSPKLFAAYHVFHRLLVPRHPPCALLRLTIHIYSVICAAGSIFMSFILVLLYLFSYGLSSVPILGCLVMNLFIDLQTIHRIFFFYMRFSRYVCVLITGVKSRIASHYFTPERSKKLRFPRSRIFGEYPYRPPNPSLYTQACNAFLRCPAQAAVLIITWRWRDSNS